MRRLTLFPKQSDYNFVNNAVHIIKQVHGGGAESLMYSLTCFLDEYEHTVITCSAQFGEQSRFNRLRYNVIDESGSDPLTPLFRELRPRVVFFHWYPDRYENFNDYFASYRFPGDKVPIWLTIIHDAGAQIPRIVSTSCYVAVSQYIARFHSHIGTESLAIIPNGVAIPPLRPKENNNVRPRIVRACRADADRIDSSFFALLASISDLDWEFLLMIISGPMVEAIRNWIELYELSERVTLEVDVEDVVDRLLGSDIYFDYNPLICREAWGLAVSEALSCGLPVITAKRYAVVEQVSHNSNGILCSDDSDFESGLRQLIMNKALLKKMSYNARHYAEGSLRIEKTADKYRKLISGF